MYIYIIKQSTHGGFVGWCASTTFSVRVRGDTKVAASYRDIVSFCLSCLSFGEEAFELRILGPG